MVIDNKRGGDVHCSLSRLWLLLPPTAHHPVFSLWLSQGCTVKPRKQKQDGFSQFWNVSQGVTGMILCGRRKVLSSSLSVERKTPGYGTSNTA